MNGGICQSATRILTSALGLEILNTFSSLLKLPLRPVTASILAVSIGALSSANAGDKDWALHKRQAENGDDQTRWMFHVNLLLLLPATRLLLLNDDVVGNAVAGYAELDLAARDPNFSASGIIGACRLDAELALFDKPLGDDPAAHRDDPHAAIAHVLLGKMRVVGDLHAADLGLDLGIAQLTVGLRGRHGRVKQRSPAGGCRRHDGNSYVASPGSSWFCPVDENLAPP